MEFSVIVPALNEETCIEACLKSILRQTLPRNSYEIIVSDGASNDRTVEIARKYADRVVVSEKRGIWREETRERSLPKAGIWYLLMPIPESRRIILRQFTGISRAAWLG
jgi:glycosyltransferase involved in cell wall biosynthesis